MITVGNEVQIYTIEPEEDKGAKEEASNSWVERFKRSKFVVFFWLLFVVLLPIILLFRVVGIIALAIRSRLGKHRRRS
jgi:hypothetical protein